MIKEENILLPGLSKQFRMLREHAELKGLSILVVGSASEEIAKEFAILSENHIELIVEDFDSLMTSKLVVGETDGVTVKMMDFHLTDYEKAQFDLIYAQGSTASFERNKIIKELKRILKPGGILCVGELVLDGGSAPQFVKNIFSNSGMLPLRSANFADYFIERNFEILLEEDFTNTLHRYYTANLKKLVVAKEELSEDEQKYYKKVLKKVNHESGAFLKQGADKHMGFKALICKRGED